MTIKDFQLRISKFRKDEIALSALLLVLTLVLNVLYIRKFFGVDWPLISGYDQFLLSTLDNWFQSRYLNSNFVVIYSHPGFGLFMAPLSALNYILLSITGSSYAIYILSIILMILFITETILLKRILNEYIGIKLSLSFILSTLFSGMAYALLMSFTPDHFAFSQFFLILFVYLWTENKNGNKKTLSVITICIGCITITNGIKIILSKLLFERKEFLKCLFLNIIVLSSMILISMFLTRNIVYPTNSGEIANQKQEYKMPVDPEQNYIDIIKPIYWGYIKWINTDVSRTNSFINNMFGQSILFHSNSLNQDNVSMGYYPELWKNILNILIVVMVACGIVLSIKTKLMQLLLCFLSVDIFIHLVCCFGISELYIYSPHYLFIFVISIGYLIKRTSGLLQGSIITTTILMTCTLYLNNLSELINYLR